MRTVVVGGGPVGMFCGMALARRGQQVTIVDRDPGPPGTGGWARRGVMQFHHPHFFRSIVRQALLDTLPEAWDAVVAAGGIPARPDGFPEELTGCGAAGRPSSGRPGYVTVPAVAPARRHR